MSKSKSDLVLQRRLKAIMQHRDGRAWMWEHLSRCGVFTTSYVNNSLDMSFNEGRRNVGLALLADLQEHAFTDYQKMESEAWEQRNEEVEDDVSEQ